MFRLTYDDCVRHKDRFETKIDRRGGPDACHPHTTKSQYTDGYGMMGMRVGDQYKHVRLHRFAYVLATGESLESQDYVDHVVCNTPRCCNPNHLRKTDARGNAQSGKRDIRGSGRRGRPRFTDDQAMAYRRRWAAGESLSSLTHGSGVRGASMWSLVHGKSYRHLPVLHRSASFVPRTPKTRLTVAEVALIKARLLAGESRAALAREYGVTPGQIGRIARGEQWVQVTPAALEPMTTAAMAAD